MLFGSLASFFPLYRCWISLAVCIADAFGGVNSPPPQIGFPPKISFPPYEPEGRINTGGEAAFCESSFFSRGFCVDRQTFPEKIMKRQKGAQFDGVMRVYSNSMFTVVWMLIYCYLCAMPGGTRFMLPSLIY